MRDAYLDMAIAEWGEPTDRRPVVASILTKYRSILPANVLSYWAEEGFCQFHNGLFFTVNPDDWQFVVDEWIEGTPFARLGRFYALTRSAFGKLVVFNERIGAVTTIDPLMCSVYASSTESASERMIQITTGFAFCPRRQYMELTDQTGKPLFSPALAKLGPVGWDEMYAFEPALALGGSPRLENLVKVAWRVHMTLLRQMTDVHVPFTDINLPKGVI